MAEQWMRRRALGATALLITAALSLAACASTVPAPVPPGGQGSPTAGASRTPSPSPADTPTRSPAPGSVAPPQGGSGSDAPTPPGTAPEDGEPARWQPPARATWQYQLSGKLDLSVDAAVFDIDWEDTTAAQVKQLKDRGRAVVCYVNAGAYEEWRGDAKKFPKALLGDPLDGWPGERWLDIRNTEALLPILAARMDVCKEKGFDGVETDNVDGYSNESGFPLTAQDQLDFNRAIAQLAHDRGLAIGLKNNVEQIPELQPSFDFAVNEECLAYEECSTYSPFIQAGKPVFHVEYETPSAEGCARAEREGLSTIIKDLDLEAGLETC